jgi:hypothetical protein
MIDWRVERIVHFDFRKGDFVVEGLGHFGFHDRAGNNYLLEHQRHFLGLLGSDGKLKWTVAARQVFEGTPNIRADLQFPIYTDRLPDGTLVVSNFGDSRLFRIYPEEMRATLFVDGSMMGMKHAGNCVVDDEGYVWLNEVEGCKVWKFDSTGKPLLTLGTGEPGFQSETSDFNHVRFNWIYDIRKGPDGNIYVLDSKNYAVRMIDAHANRVETIAGTGKPGYEGDGGDPRLATFGSSPSARFDGPISLSLDEQGNIYVGDRFNHVVRVIEKETNTIRTLAGDAANTSERPNDPNEHRLISLRLPKISSMDYYEGRLFIPTDLQEDTGDLIVLRKRQLD